MGGQPFVKRSDNLNGVQSNTFAGTSGKVGPPCLVNGSKFDTYKKQR